jgi:hypothetical protein
MTLQANQPQVLHATITIAEQSQGNFRHYGVSSAQPLNGA